MSGFLDASGASGRRSAVLTIQKGVDLTCTSLSGFLYGGGCIGTQFTTEKIAEDSPSDDARRRDAGPGRCVRERG